MCICTYACLCSKLCPVVHCIYCVAVGTVQNCGWMASLMHDQDGSVHNQPFEGSIEHHHHGNLCYVLYYGDVYFPFPFNC